MIFKTNFEPLIEDYDRNGRITLCAIMKFLENAGNRHSDAVGDSVIEGSTDGFSWILTDWNVTVDFYPEYRQKLAAQTWIEKPSSPFGITRDIVLYADGKQCAAGTTKWVLFNTEKKRLCKVEPSLLSSYAPERKSLSEDKRLEKITIPETFESATEITLRRTDIDFNNHVHNLCYLDFALESLPKEKYDSASFKNLRISYKTAITEGDKAVCKLHCGNARTTVELYSESGELCCLVELV